MVLKRSDDFKRTFWCHRILQKQQMNEFVIVVKTNTFVRFLGVFEDTQSTFVIIWPLEDQKTFFLLQFLTYYSIHVGSITLKSSDLLFCFSFYRLHISLIYPVDFFAFFRYQKKIECHFSDARRGVRIRIFYVRKLRQKLRHMTKVFHIVVRMVWEEWGIK